MLKRACLCKLFLIPFKIEIFLDGNSQFETIEQFIEALSSGALATYDVLCVERKSDFRLTVHQSLSPN